MKKLLLSIILTFLSIVSFAQDKLKIEMVRNDNKSIDFNYTNNTFATYYVEMKINELVNSSSSDNISGVSRPGIGKLGRITPSESDQNISFRSYSYQYILGNPNSKIDSNFIYVLPIPQDSEFIVRKAGLISSKLIGEETPGYFNSFSFYMKETCQILCIRKGTVIEITDLYEVSPDVKFSYKSKNNSILIQHEDGSVARYIGFAKGSSLVKEGDVVYPKIPLAQSVKYSSDDKMCRFSVMVSYPKKDPFNIPESKTFKESISNPRYNYINLKFYFANNEIDFTEQKTLKAPTAPKDIVQQEFTKKELKNMPR